MSIKSNVTKALDAAHSYDDAITALKTDCAGKSRDEVRAAMLPAVAAHPKYNVKVVDGKLCPESPKYETARKALLRLVAAVCGIESSAKHEPVAVPAKVTKQVKVLVAEVIASGMTKAQFDAMVAELRASVSFK
jgi:hypothetical protein